MKKSYINPQTRIVLLTMRTMIAVSGFDEKMDNNEPINPETILSRRRTVWDDEDEEDEDW